MKTSLTKINLLSAAFLLFFSASAMALPSIGNNVTITGGPLQNGAGGEFNLNILGNVNSFDYFSFCLEYDEHISLGGTYMIQSVEDFASDGGLAGQTQPNRDYISEATKSVMWNYYNLQPNQKSYTLAGIVQKVIWFLEGEVQTLSEDSLDFYKLNVATLASDYVFSGGVVKVLNLRTINRDETLGDVNAQSQLIAEPVPEPATMLLFGTGIAGLSSMIRRRRMKG
ncbi:MAG: PEP-CTERM sorting domain-containing protein [Desulfobulbaceae bacterium]|nr:PEP-CTERM sorting domain-containing protein [Desulfobulbaceae bacterium]